MGMFSRLRRALALRKSVRRLQRLWDEFLTVSELNSSSDWFAAMLDDFSVIYQRFSESLDQEQYDEFASELTVMLTQLFTYLEGAPTSSTEMAAVAELLDKILSAAELILRDPRYQSHIRDSTFVVERLVQLLYTTQKQTEADKRTVLRLVRAFGEQGNAVLFGQLQGFAALVDAIDETAPTLTRDFLQTLVPYLSVTDSAQADELVEDESLTTRLASVFARGLQLAGHELRTALTPAVTQVHHVDTDHISDADDERDCFPPPNEEVGAALATAVSQPGALPLPFGALQRARQSLQPLDTDSKEAELVRELMAVQGVLPKLTSILEEAAEEVELDLFSALEQLLVTPGAANGMEKCGGWVALRRHIMTRIDHAAPAEAESIVSDVISMLTRISYGGRDKGPISNGSPLTLLGYFACSDLSLIQIPAASELLRLAVNDPPTNACFLAAFGIIAQVVRQLLYVECTPLLESLLVEIIRQCHVVMANDDLGTVFSILVSSLIDAKLGIPRPFSEVSDSAMEALLKLALELARDHNNSKTSWASIEAPLAALLQQMRIALTTQEFDTLTSRPEFYQLIIVLGNKMKPDSALMVLQPDILELVGSVPPIDLSISAKHELVVSFVQLAAVDNHSLKRLVTSLFQTHKLTSFLLSCISSLQHPPLVADSVASSIRVRHLLQLLKTPLAPLALEAMVYLCGGSEQFSSGLRMKIGLSPLAATLSSVVEGDPKLLSLAGALLCDVCCDHLRFCNRFLDRIIEPKRISPPTRLLLIHYISPMTLTDHISSLSQSLVLVDSHESDATNVEDCASSDGELMTATTFSSVDGQLRVPSTRPGNESSVFASQARYSAVPLETVTSWNALLNLDESFLAMVCDATIVSPEGASTLIGFLLDNDPLNIDLYMTTLLMMVVANPSNGTLLCDANLTPRVVSLIQEDDSRATRFKSLVGAVLSFQACTCDLQALLKLPAFAVPVLQIVCLCPFPNRFLFLRPSLQHSILLTDGLKKGQQISMNIFLPITPASSEMQRLVSFDSSSFTIEIGVCYLNGEHRIFIQHGTSAKRIDVFDCPLCEQRKFTLNLHSTRDSVAVAYEDEVISLDYSFINERIDLRLHGGQFSCVYSDVLLDTSPLSETIEDRCIHRTDITGLLIQGTYLPALFLPVFEGNDIELASSFGSLCSLLIAQSDKCLETRDRNISYLSRIITAFFACHECPIDLCQTFFSAFFSSLNTISPTIISLISNLLYCSVDSFALSQGLAYVFGPQMVGSYFWELFRNHVSASQDELLLFLGGFQCLSHSPMFHSLSTRLIVDLLGNTSSAILESVFSFVLGLDPEESEPFAILILESLCDCIVVHPEDTDVSETLLLQLLCFCKRFTSRNIASVVVSLLSTIRQANSRQFMELWKEIDGFNLLNSLLSQHRHGISLSKALVEFSFVEPDLTASRLSDGSLDKEMLSGNTVYTREVADVHVHMMRSLDDAIFFGSMLSRCDKPNLVVDGLNLLSAAIEISSRDVKLKPLLDLFPIIAILPNLTGQSCFEPSVQLLTAIFSRVMSDGDVSDACEALNRIWNAPLIRVASIMSISRVLASLDLPPESICEGLNTITKHVDVEHIYSPYFVDPVECVSVFTRIAFSGTSELRACLMNTGLSQRREQIACSAFLFPSVLLRDTDDDLTIRVATLLQGLPIHLDPDMLLVPLWTVCESEAPFEIRKEVLKQLINVLHDPTDQLSKWEHYSYFEPLCHLNVEVVDVETLDSIHLEDVSFSSIHDQRDQLMANAKQFEKTQRRYIQSLCSYLASKAAQSSKKRIEHLCGFYDDCLHQSIDLIATTTAFAEEAIGIAKTAADLLDPVFVDSVITTPIACPHTMR